MSRAGEGHHHVHTRRQIHAHIVEVLPIGNKNKNQEQMCVWQENSCATKA